MLDEKKVEVGKKYLNIEKIVKVIKAFETQTSGQCLPKTCEKLVAIASDNQIIYIDQKVKYI